MTIAPLVLRSNELRTVSNGEARAVGRGFGGCEMSELGSTIGSGEQRCLATQKATTTIPIIMATIGDPVGRAPLAVPPRTLWPRRLTAEPAMEETIDIALRLGAAALVGMLIGVNRDLANKPIGMRTLGLVALGAAIVSLAGVQVEGMAEHPDALGRVVQGIIQGVMAGISFIGAGVILRDREARRVEGLTTAPTVWVTAALGIACGLAAWEDRRHRSRAGPTAASGGTLGGIDIRGCHRRKPREKRPLSWLRAA
jgi:putative Mg2+ transporter-C (MgtC) family protein